MGLPKPWDITIVSDYLLTLCVPQNLLIQKINSSQTKQKQAVCACTLSKVAHFSDYH